MTSSGTKNNLHRFNQVIGETEDLIQCHVCGGLLVKKSIQDITKGVPWFTKWFIFSDYYYCCKCDAYIPYQEELSNE